MKAFQLIPFNSWDRPLITKLKKNHNMYGLRKFVKKAKNLRAV